MGCVDAKGVLESVFGQGGVQVKYEPSESSIMHPGRTARLVYGDTAIGVIGEVHPKVLESFDLEGSPVALFEIDVEALNQAMPQTARRYQSASRFPESYRDLALVVDADVSSSRIQFIIERHNLVARSIPFDVYSGEGVPSGKKSVAYRVVFQSNRETLTSEQVDKFQSDILRQLQRDVGAALRG